MTKNSDELAEKVRALVENELDCLSAIATATGGLGEDGLDRLAKCALVLQRIRQPFTPPDPTDPSAPKIPYTDKQLMEKGGTINE